jgi:hypothetical protein
MMSAAVLVLGICAGMIAMAALLAVLAVLTMGGD